VSLDVEPSLPPTGALVVSLWWDTEADLDLHVVDPYGVEIWAGNINSYDRYATTPAPDAGVLDEDGILDFDSTVAASSMVGATRMCLVAGRASRRLCGPRRHLSLCGNSAARWTVEALLNGISLDKAEGEALPSSQRFSKGKGSGVTALSFTVASHESAGERLRAGDTCGSARNCGFGNRRLRDSRDCFACEEVGEAGLSTPELRQIPGAQGDAGKALENLPGVARPGLAAANWWCGRGTRETRVVVDGWRYRRCTIWVGCARWFTVASCAQ